jgi:hypothetical protein
MHRPKSEEVRSADASVSRWFSLILSATVETAESSEYVSTVRKEVRGLVFLAGAAATILTARKTRDLLDEDKISSIISFHFLFTTAPPRTQAQQERSR